MSVKLREARQELSTAQKQLRELTERLQQDAAQTRQGCVLSKQDKSTFEEINAALTEDIRAALGNVGLYLFYHR